MIAFLHVIPFTLLTLCLPLVSSTFNPYCIQVLPLCHPLLPPSFTHLPYHPTIMSFIFHIFYSNQSSFENMSTNMFITILKQFQKYFLDTKPTKWNFGRYKQQATNYCTTHRIHLTSTEVYSTTWVGFLEEFSHPYACTKRSVQIGIQRTMELEDYAKTFLDVSIDQIFLT